MDYRIISLSDMPELEERAARWFHEKWGIPTEAYRRSMDNCLSGRTPFPQWYAAVEDGRIIGGLGIIANDFHDRKDLVVEVPFRRVDQFNSCPPYLISLKIVYQKLGYYFIA